MESYYVYTFDGLGEIKIEMAFVLTSNVRLLPLLGGYLVWHVKKDQLLFKLVKIEPKLGLIFGIKT